MTAKERRLYKEKYIDELGKIGVRKYPPVLATKRTLKILARAISKQTRARGKLRCDWELKKIQ